MVLARATSGNPPAADGRPTMPSPARRLCTSQPVGRSPGADISTVARRTTSQRDRGTGIAERHSNARRRRHESTHTKTDLKGASTSLTLVRNIDIIVNSVSNGTGMTLDSGAFANAQFSGLFGKPRVDVPAPARHERIQYVVTTSGRHPWPGKCPCPRCVPWRTFTGRGRNLPRLPSCDPNVHPMEQRCESPGDY
jgi:hypothetical protein